MFHTWVVLVKKTSQNLLDSLVFRPLAAATATKALVLVAHSLGDTKKRQTSESGQQ